ncbi:MAG: hypothetical protein HFE30_05455 [Clostridiales bacterium]|nr:hypothetical protein [Clostridiales bacterium]
MIVNMVKKITAAVLLLSLTAALMASCDKDNTDSKKPTNESGEVSQTGGNADSTYDYVDKYVAELAEECGGYNGKTVTVISRDTDLPTEEAITGNLTSDALYRRNMEIEDKFNVKMTSVLATGEGYTDGAPSLEIADKVKTDTMARTGEYDIIICNIMIGGTNMLIDGTIRPVDDLPALNFSKSWWLNDLEEQLSIGERLYYLTGKVVTGHYSDPAAIIYSKDMAAKYNIGDIYSYVNDGTWTIDKMQEIASVVPTGNDTYRYYAQGGIDLLMGGGITLSGRDADGKPTLPNQLDNNTVSYMEKIASFLNDKTQNIHNDNVIILGSGSTYTAEDAWDDGKFLFWLDNMGRAADVLERETEFGILPIPKKDETQENYISYCKADRTAAIFISKSAKDTEMSAYLIEAMAALSEKHLEPAYYDKLLKGRSADGIDERRMLDLIYTTKKYDLADIYKWGEIAKTIDGMLASNIEGLASTYRASIRMATLELDNMIEAIQNEK